MAKRTERPGDTVLDSVRKEFGEESIVRLTDKPVTLVPSIHSGSICVDHALGIGGWPRGRICEIYGPESSGKTTLTLHAIASAQANGELCAFVDAEHAFDAVYAKAVGVDLEGLLFSQPEYGEQALGIVEHLVLSGEVSLVVIDSVAALTPKAEIDGEMGDSHVGLQARMMSQAMRKLASIAFKNEVCLIFLNQIRNKIGVMYGNPETTTGGNALKFYASVRVKCSRTSGGIIKEGEDLVGSKLKIKVEKNKVAPPFREAEVSCMWGKGIDQGADLLNAALGMGIVQQNGAWFSFEQQRVAQGFNNAVRALVDNPALHEAVRVKTREVMFGVPG